MGKQKIERDLRIQCREESERKPFTISITDILNDAMPLTEAINFRLRFTAGLQEDFYDDACENLRDWI